MENVAWTDDKLTERFDAVNQRFDAVDRRFDSLNQRLDLRFDAVDRQFAELGRRFDETDHRFGRLEAETRSIRDSTLQLHATLFRFCSAIVFALIGVIGAILVKGG